jgi:phage terminase large subunit-like protein
MWDLSCPDWEDRIREGRSLIPELPLNVAEADLGLAMFDELRLPDVPGTPKMRDACGQWFRDLVRVAFGSWFPELQQRFIRDILALLPKGQSKTTYIAGLLLTGLLMNKRPRAEALFIGPTQAIAENAYDKAVGMIELSADLKRRFRTRDHVKTIEDLVTHTELKIKTFDVNILTGTILILAVLEEIHLLGRNPHATKVLRQIRGGLEKTPEGLLLMPTTMPDDIPAGVFKDEIKFARRMRDGKYRGRIVRPMLPILCEFPPAIAKDQDEWERPENWAMVMPNLGRSVKLDSLVADWQSEREKGEHAIRIWASQHLNIEIGVGITNDGWRGADFWEDAADPTLTLDALLARSEVVTIGIDGGGLDDLLGLCVIGREKGTREWLIWNHAWANPKVLELRQDIAPRLLDFKEAGTLTICPVPDDMVELGGIVTKIVETGLLPEKDAIGFDPNNVAMIVETLVAIEGVTDEMLRRLMQGTALSPAWWGLERKLSDGTVWHAGLEMMAWVIGNAKVERRGNAVLITKQLAGVAKIDPLIATGCAAILMSWNPSASGHSFWEVAAKG